MPPPSKGTETPAQPSCPRCGGQMGAGFIACAGRANWVDTMGTLDATPGQGETLINSTDILVRIPHLRGWRCKKCRVALVDYGAGVVFSPWTAGPLTTP